MSKLLQSLAITAVVVLVTGCSAQQHQETTRVGRQEGSIDTLAGKWGEPDTIMTLANGNTLYVFGGGEYKKTATRVRAIPGHALVLLSENGKPPRFIQDRIKNTSVYKNDTTQRIVWVETNRAGNILSAGCSGCTEEEKRLLAAQSRGETEKNASANRVVSGQQ